MAIFAAIIGRICIAVLFIFAGAGKLMDPAGTAQYMGSAGLPENLALPAGIFEIVAGLMLGLGIMTRLTAVVLVGFTAIVTLIFHNQITDQMQSAMALKNLAIIGGLLMVFAYGQVSWRMSTWKERAGRHDAELAAARAEARADALENNRTVVVDEVPNRERRGLFSSRRPRTLEERTDGNPFT